MPQMSPDTALSGLSRPAEPEHTAPEPVTPYYSRGVQLKAKHDGTKMVSGRSLETWALGLVPVKAVAKILDAGCGWGRFTWPLIETFALTSTNVTGIDTSLGMLETAAEEGQRRRRRPAFASADIQALPFPPGYFDAAMANHVLYHLPDIHKGVGELARVLKEDGWLLATTNSDDVQVPVLEFHYAALDELSIGHNSGGHSSFSMENGGEILGAGFSNVDRHFFDDETRYTSADQFLASYKTIGRYRNLLAREDINPEKKRQLQVLVRQRAEEVISRTGELRSPVRMGAFVCTGPRK